MNCNQCPRQCDMDRTKTLGYCGMQELKISKVMKHYCEEPIISGANGSGTIFFTGCSLKCCYCQNYKISHERVGEKITVNQLADIFAQLEKSGVNNINLVSPTHYTNEIIHALNIYKPHIPIVWNTSGYETVENIVSLKDYVDIYLCDFKYFDDNYAIKYSNAPNYMKKCSEALLQMRINQPQDIIKDEVMQKGVIVRHLVLPTLHNDSVKIFEWIGQNLGTDTIISVMSQFMPCFRATDYAELSRSITPLEYTFVTKKIQNLGFENGFFQELSSSSDCYVPDFIKSPLIDL